MKKPLALPCESVSMSPWYQASPNGAVGAWIIKKSKSVFGGRPVTYTLRYSTGPVVWSLAYPTACGRQLFAPADTGIWNWIVVVAFDLAAPACA